jgi:DNA-binding transcriptional LysR family regulator
VVASPAYLAANGTPGHPRDLVRHRCIGWRRSPEIAPYRWEFEENGTAFNVAVEPQITTNDLRFMLRSALARAGITFATEEIFRPTSGAVSSSPCSSSSCRLSQDFISISRTDGTCRRN